MQNYLLLKHGGGYILGIIPHPDPSVDPLSAAHRNLNNLPEEQEFLCMYSNTYLAWDTLKSCYEKYSTWLPKENDFLTIMMLNVMSDDLPHIQNHIMDALSTSSSTNAYGPSNIRAPLDVEQQLINTEKMKGSGDLAMMATGKGG
ncbi:uncharacterized protein BJ212DRAFT_1294408 [Suillus subaureus]|uniref:Uncharacterized protein n=1 Tax=Suillus subaureus TaxID=48587 RepID=A0A9P7EPL5_9AGAM|nr:uncharacterized protein BJ212DRAFT_1294408 [Suillus subaureus]KAG1827026.1 hypothetical protein BJ212DRAFT_1294408 [Suillus subaureus]